jgi:hypothetical protein
MAARNFVTLEEHGLAALAQAQNCSNASWNGTHFFLTTGTYLQTIGAEMEVIPYAQLGKPSRVPIW